jgi:hypothetical protein
MMLNQNGEIDTDKCLHDQEQLLVPPSLKSLPGLRRSHPLQPLPLLLQEQEPSISLFFSHLSFSRPLSRLALPNSACPAAPLHSRVYLSKTQRPACAVRYDNWARLPTDIAALVFSSHCEFPVKDKV